MTVMSFLLAVTAVVWVIVTVVVLVQNERVLAARLRMLARIDAEAKRRIAAGQFDWKDLYDALDSVPYNDMLRQPWRRIDSMWPPLLRSLPDVKP